PPFGCSFDEAGDSLFVQDASRQRVAGGLEFQYGSHVEGKISGFVGKGEQRLDGGGGAGAGGGRAAFLPPMSGPALEIGERGSCERLSEESDEAGGIGGVGSPGVGTGFGGQPQLYEVGVLGAVVGGSKSRAWRQWDKLIHRGDDSTICFVIVRLI